MGANSYMRKLIDKARSGVRSGIENMGGPMKRLSEGLEGKPITPIKPLPTELPKITPAIKRKKIKKKTTMSGRRCGQ